MSSLNSIIDSSETELEAVKDLAQALLNRQLEQATTRFLQLQLQLKKGVERGLEAARQKKVLGKAPKVWLVTVAYRLF